MKIINAREQAFNEIEKLRLAGYSKKEAAAMLGVTSPALDYYYRDKRDLEWKLDKDFRFNNRPQDCGRRKKK